MSSEKDKDTQTVVIKDGLRNLKRIGSGGMGEVFSAERVNTAANFTKKVAIKRLLRKFRDGDAAVHQKMINKFLDEARLAANLNHPNIVQIFDVRFHPGTDEPEIEMEFVEGKTLRELLEPKKGMGARPLPPECAVRIIEQVLSALKYAHNFSDPITGAKKRIIHADINPRNIMVTPSGHVKLLDFGIGKALLPDEDSATTSTFEGTPGYLSPERAAGMRPDEASDIYAVGLVFFELLTGVKLFDLRVEARVQLSPISYSDRDLETRIFSIDGAKEYGRVLFSWLRKDVAHRQVPDHLNQVSRTFFPLNYFVRLSRNIASQLNSSSAETALFTYRNKNRLVALLVFLASLVSVAILVFPVSRLESKLETIQKWWSNQASVSSSKTSINPLKVYYPRFDRIRIILQSEKRRINFDEDSIARKAKHEEMSALSCSSIWDILLDLNRSIMSVQEPTSRFMHKAARAAGVSAEHISQLFVRKIGTAQGEETLKDISLLCGRFESVGWLSKITAEYRRFYDENPDAVLLGNSGQFQNALKTFNSPAWAQPILKKALSIQNRPRPNSDQIKLINSFVTKTIRPIGREDSSPDHGSNWAMHVPPGYLSESHTQELLDFQTVGVLLSSLTEAGTLYLQSRATMLSIPNSLALNPIVSETLKADGAYELKLSLRDDDLSRVLREGVCISQRFGEGRLSTHSKCYRL
jgi:serine/threonine protein kinase